MFSEKQVIMSQFTIGYMLGLWLVVAFFVAVAASHLYFHSDLQVSFSIWLATYTTKQASPFLLLTTFI